MFEFGYIDVVGISVFSRNGVCSAHLFLKVELDVMIRHHLAKLY